MAINYSEPADEFVTRSTAQPEDASEGSLRPRLLNEYIGQEKAKENLRVFIQAARDRGDSPDHGRRGRRSGRRRNGDTGSGGDQQP